MNNVFLLGFVRMSPRTAFEMMLKITVFFLCFVQYISDLIYDYVYRKISYFWAEHELNNAICY